MTNWDKFYKEVMELPMVVKIKKWCDNNGVQFEPYARDTRDNSMKCTCCYFGNIDSDAGDYLEIKLGENGSFEMYNYEWEEEVVEDEEGNYEIDVKVEYEKDTNEMLEEYTKSLNGVSIAHKLSDDRMIDFCLTFGFEFPEDHQTIIAKQVEKEME